VDFFDKIIVLTRLDWFSKRKIKIPLETRRYNILHDMNMWVSRPRFRGEPITALCENCIEINSLYVYRHITATTPPHSSLDNIGFSFSLILSLPTPTRSPIHITTGRYDYILCIYIYIYNIHTIATQSFSGFHKF